MPKTTNPFFLEIKKWAKPLSRKQIMEIIDKYVDGNINSWESSELREFAFDTCKYGSKGYFKFNKKALIKFLYENIDEEYFEDEILKKPS